MISERHVQAIWYDESLRPKSLRTRRGSSVVVVSPGEWNLGPGPDFRNAVLEIGKNRERVTGDVEIHLCPRDWDFHRHGSDPNYRNVIAHITWGCGPIPSSLPPGAVSIWIGRFVTAETSFSPDQIDLAAYPYARLPISERPCKKVFENDPDKAREVLVAAGRHRLLMKARRLTGRLGEESPVERSQVFYEEVMTALGYVKNATAFRNIARRIPISALPRETQLLQRAYLVASTFEEFDRRCLRPHNTPEARLVHAAEVMSETPVLTFSEATDFSRAGCRSMTGAMCGMSGHCMGMGRAAAVLANVIVPFALAENRIGDVPEWLPPEDISSPVRLTAFRLFGRDHNPAAFYAGNGLLIQGLLQIHRDCCLKNHPDCGACNMTI